MTRSIWRWFTCSWVGDGDERMPAELIALRFCLVGLVVFLVAETLATRPHPSLHGDGLAILVATVALIVAALLSAPRRRTGSAVRTLVLLALITAASCVLDALQPNGVWQFGPTYVAVIAAVRLERPIALATLGLSTIGLVVVTEVEHHGNGAVSVLFSAVPWFLIMRMLRIFRQQRDELAASRAAESRAAASAERGRIAREMHDVLAHSLSALALALESARLVARDRGTDPEVCGALDRAHHLAAAGLQEARRAIAAARGDELPGPERLGVLVRAFSEQSGLPASLQLSGEPRELAPDARLAIYRTAQEALTNVRRHAPAERVEVSLRWEPGEAVLAIHDHGAPALAAVGAAAGPASDGYGLTGMRERAELLGGRLRAQPTADGFMVELRLPA
jgi:signal transduction histidine kinase